MSGPSSVSRSQPPPRLSPTELPIEGTVAGKQPSVGTPLGARLRAFMHRVFSRNKSSDGDRPLAGRGVGVGTPKPNRKQRAAQTKTGKMVGDLMGVLKSASNGKMKITASDRLAVRTALNDLPKTKDADLEFSQALRAQLDKMPEQDVRAMYRKLVDGEATGERLLDKKDPHFALLQLELLKKSPLLAVQDEGIRHLLLDSVKNEYSSENLTCLSAVEQLLDPKKPANKEEVAGFFNQYVKAGVDRQVNISDVLRGKLETALGGTGTADQRAEALGAIRGEVTNLIVRDSVPRFLTSLRPGDLKQ